MPLITISNWRGRERGRALHDAVRAAVLGIPELGLDDPNQATVVFGGEDLFGDPCEQNPLMIAIEYLFDRDERTYAARQQLAAAVGLAAKSVVGARMVEVVVRAFHPSRGEVDDLLARASHEHFWKG